jgi:hypothetical protein
LTPTRILKIDDVSPAEQGSDSASPIHIRAGVCLANSGLFFAAIFACKHLGDNEYRSPALAA